MHCYLKDTVQLDYLSTRELAWHTRSWTDLTEWEVYLYNESGSHQHALTVHCTKYTTPAYTYAQNNPNQ